MKNLLYKELKLSIHPLCYVFIFGFGFMVLIPQYPVVIGFIYTLASYTFIFIGVNKGQSTNDLLYTVTLPIRKQEVIKARLLSISLMHLMTMLMLLILSPIKVQIDSQIIAEQIAAGIPEAEVVADIGFGADCIFGIFSTALICFAIHDLIYFSMFYKHGKSVVAPTLVGILIFTVLLMGFSVFIPLAFPSLIQFFKISNQSTILYQVIIFIISLLFYLGMRLITYKVSYKELEQIDF